MVKSLKRFKFDIGDCVQIICDDLVWPRYQGPLTGETPLSTRDRELACKNTQGWVGSVVNRLKYTSYITGDNNVYLIRIEKRGHIVIEEEGLIYLPRCKAILLKKD